MTCICSRLLIVRIREACVVTKICRYVLLIRVVEVLGLGKHLLVVAALVSGVGVCDAHLNFLIVVFLEILMAFLIVHLFISLIETIENINLFYFI